MARCDLRGGRLGAGSCSQLSPFSPWRSPCACRSPACRSPPRSPLAVGLARTGAGRATNTTADSTPAPTFYREVLPILQENCQECHRTAGTSYGGQLAPMGLETYDEARPWAKSIAKQVESREMPPWDASPQHKGVFLNERSLEDDEIATLVRWASTGAPAGNPKDAPPRRVFVNHDGWMIGEPSLIVKMPEPYFVKDDVKDLYAAFYVDLTDDMLPKDMWIKAFQCKPGSRIIHHFNAHLAYPDEEGGLPEPPSFPGEGQLAPPRAGTFIGGIASGTDSLPLPEGFGIPLKKGTRVTFDVHYHKEPGEGTGVWDRSEIGFLLTDTPPIARDGRQHRPARTARRLPDRDPARRQGPPARAGHRHLHQGLGDRQPDAAHAHARRGGEVRGDLSRRHAARCCSTCPSTTSRGRPSIATRSSSSSRRAPRSSTPRGTTTRPSAARRYGFDPAQTVTFGEESTDEMMMGFVTSAAVARDATGCQD